jgi:hypothetical protein
MSYFGIPIRNGASVGLGSIISLLSGSRSAPSLSLNFLSGSLDSRIFFTRASTGTYFDSAGVLQTAAINAPRFDYDPSTLAAQGLLIEEARTNSIRNSTMVGAVAGTPGTAPTNWAIGLGGLTQEIVGTGSFNGVSYIDVRLSGTTTGVAASILLETITGVPWTNTQVFTLSAWWQIVGGSAANITSPALSVNGYDASSVFLSGAFTSGGQVGSLSTTWQRITRTFTGNNAALAYGRPLLSMSFAVGAAIDITLRIGLPQLELGAFATSVIPTTTVAATRAADYAVITTLAPWYNATASTIYTEFRAALTTAAGATTSLNDATANNRVTTFVSSSSFSAGRNTGGAGVVFAPSTAYAPTTAVNKVALAIADLNTAICGNGGTVVTSAVYNVPTVTQLQIGNQLTTSYLNGHIRTVTYYPSRLSNAQLRALTV